MKSTRKQALRIAQRLGCYGAHQNEDGAWMPCADHETFTSVSRGEKPASKKWFMPELQRKAASIAGRGRLFSSREEAVAESKRNGCSGVRVVIVNGGKMYAACMPRNNGAPENTGMISPRKRDFEPLGESGVIGIDTLPDGGLVSGKNLGPTIGAQPANHSGQQRDGDGDGFVSSTPGGPDDTRVSPKNTSRPQKNQKKPPKGQVVKGNINLNNRPVVKNRDGSISTVRSISIGEDNLTVVIPTVIRNPDGTGKIVSNQEAINHYRKTRQHLGKFTNPKDADTYAVNLHNEQAAQYLPKRKSLEAEEDITPIDAKGFVNYVSRSTDPDVYTDPDSARVRSRQLGCIGIRSYTARDGKRVYLPCTNGSDYNRTMNLRPDGNRKKKSDCGCGCGEKSLAQTPAPKKDKIFGSRKNRVGSAGSLRSAGDISMTPEIVASLTKKVREHNTEVKKSNKEDWSKTNLRALKAVYRRGAGAFSVSHRPGMNRNQWAMGRVNAFLRLLSSGSAKSSYTTDNDLLPSGHPWKKKGLSGKSFTIDGAEHFAEELAIGVKSIGETKFVARRFIAFPLAKECEE